MAGNAHKNDLDSIFIIAVVLFQRPSLPSNHHRWPFTIHSSERVFNTSSDRERARSRKLDSNPMALASDRGGEGGFFSTPRGDETGMGDEEAISSRLAICVPGQPGPFPFARFCSLSPPLFARPILPSLSFFFFFFFGLVFSRWNSNSPSPTPGLAKYLDAFLRTVQAPICALLSSLLRTCYDSKRPPSIPRN